MSLLNNVKWVSISQCVKVTCQLFGIVVFARYLAPQDIGVMSLTLVVVNFVNILRDMGSSAAIIQNDEIDGKIKSSVFIMNMVLGFALAIVFYTSSHYIAVFFGYDRLETTIKLITLSFIFNSIASVHLATLERDSKFKKIAFIESASSISSLAIGIFFAANNYGVYSLVSQTVSFSILTAISFYISSGWKPCLSFKLDHIKPIYKLSSNLVLFNFINYFSRNSDQLIIGKFFFHFDTG
ncbi:oligosaccharide flippase family protein [Enterobacter asburiae]|uniref:oligosaccharide flippase family protein n=1 Tax=Enterobacter asburiae TaxID=61645 RepID=UPI00192AD1F6|nr:oligosaccharide flippase family protein [Enterobacter asburiae]MBL5912426.1 oligosaccharide flippase family protein [Enterobacter asburiae]MBL5916935.1 oligosaccharide flippase family protein [Enterobacter asburiae]MBL5972165.1 oligosaccharide flippase family protein [Enterobacter asburiae]